jgi:hypothetical protein
MIFFDILKPNLEDISIAEKTLYKNTTKMWDPSGTINYDLIKSNCAKIEATFMQLEKNPNQISKQFMTSYIIGGVGTLLGILIFLINSSQFGFLIIFLSWIYTGILVSTYKKLVIDLIKLQIAKTNFWAYDPNVSKGNWRSHNQLFPELFSLGNQNQYFEDQFWGKTEFKSKDNYFHSGLFSYDVVTRDSKGRRHTTTYKKHFISVYTEKEIKTRFKISPEGVFNKIGNFFSKKEINTESNEFNKAFAFSYNGSKDNEAQNIVKVLSPAVQDKLLSMKNKKGSYSALFSNHAVTFIFDGLFFKQIHTDFKKSLVIDSRDSDFLENELNTVIDISNEIMQYLD